MPFTLFSCLMAVTTAPSTLLNRNGKNRSLYLAPDFRRKAFCFLSLTLMLAAYLLPFSLWKFYCRRLSSSSNMEVLQLPNCFHMHGTVCTAIKILKPSLTGTHSLVEDQLMEELKRHYYIKRIFFSSSLNVIN